MGRKKIEKKKGSNLKKTDDNKNWKKEGRKNMAEGKMQPKEVEKFKQTRQKNAGKQGDLKARQFLQKIAEEKRKSRAKEQPKLNQPHKFKQARQKNIGKQGDLKARQFLQKIAEEKRKNRAEEQAKRKQAEEAERRLSPFEKILKNSIDKWRN